VTGISKPQKRMFENKAVLSGYIGFIPVFAVLWIGYFT
jgi:hypothetical protein